MNLKSDQRSSSSSTSVVLVPIVLIIFSTFASALVGSASTYTYLLCDKAGRLGEFDPISGNVLAVRGVMPTVMYDIAFDPTGGLWGVDRRSDLYSINPSDGTSVRIGPLGVEANALQFRRDGLLVAVGQNKVYRIDPSTGNALEILRLPAAFESAGDIEFDAFGYAYATMTTGQFVRLDIDAGAYEVLATASYGDIYGLTLVEDGLLLGYRASAPEVVVVNTVQGRVSRLTSLGGLSMSDVYGAATDYRPKPAQLPVAPEILLQPADLLMPRYADAQFRVVVRGIHPLTYQWLHNGSPLLGETDSILYVLGVDRHTAGVYSVVVRGPGGEVLSREATLTVTAPTVLCDSTGRLYVVGLFGERSITYLSRMPITMFDIAFDPEGTLLGVDSSGLLTAVSRLYEIDVHSGNVRLIGSLGAWVNGLECADDGTLVGCGRNVIYRIDRASGAATPALTFPSDVSFSGDLVFDHENNLYGVTEDRKLLQMNSALTQWTVVGNLSEGDFFGLSFGPDHTVYGFRGGPNIELHKIDVALGTSTYAGSVRSPYLGTVYGAASDYKPLLEGPFVVEESSLETSGSPDGLRSIGFHFMSRANDRYLIESTQDVNGNGWAPIALITGDAGIRRFSERVRDIPTLYFRIRRIPAPFLSFPLRERTADTARINAVFDHSMTARFCPDGIVVAFTGEEGRAEYGDPLLEGQFRCQTTQQIGNLYSFTHIRTGAPFSVRGQYTGGGRPEYLAYDGHPGYDFRTTDQASDGAISVLAAAAGIIVSATKEYGVVIIEHSGGYQTVYIHLSMFYFDGAFQTLDDGASMVGRIVNEGEVIGRSGGTGANGLQVYPPHLHFEVRQQTDGVYLPIDPYGWESSEADPYTAQTGVVSVRMWK